MKSFRVSTITCSRSSAICFAWFCWMLLKIASLLMSREEGTSSWK